MTWGEARRPRVPAREPGARAAPATPGTNRESLLGSYLNGLVRNSRADGLKRGLAPK